MDAILRFLDQYEILFYVLLGIVVLIYARKVFLSWREWSRALFGLEKEYSQRNINQGLSVIIFTVLLAGGLFVVNTFVTPSVPGVQQFATPTLDLTQQLTPETTLTETTPTIEITTSGLIPTLSAFLDQGCIADQIQWTYPVDGESVSGKVTLTGTVNVTNLGYYKIEYSPKDSENWVAIVAGSSTIIDAPFGGSWDTRNLTPGDYRFRLVVFNNKEEELPDCTINVLVKASE